MGKGRKAGNPLEISRYFDHGDLLKSAIHLYNMKKMKKKGGHGLRYAAGPSLTPNKGGSASSRRQAPGRPRLGPRAQGPNHLIRACNSLKWGFLESSIRSKRRDSVQDTTAPICINIERALSLFLTSLELTASTGMKTL